MNQLAVSTNLFPRDPEGDLEFCNGQPGSAFAKWLIDIVSKENYQCDDPIQEDYGWGFWIQFEGTTIWVCISYAGDESDQEGHWVISCQHENPISSLLPWKWSQKKAGEKEAIAIFKLINKAVDESKDIKVINDQY